MSRSSKLLAVTMHLGAGEGPGKPRGMEGYGEPYRCRWGSGTSPGMVCIWFLKIVHKEELCCFKNVWKSQLYLSLLILQVGDPRPGAVDRLNSEPQLAGCRGDKTPICRLLEQPCPSSPRLVT